MEGLCIEDLISVWKIQVGYSYLKIVFNVDHKLYSTSYYCGGKNYEFVKNTLRELEPSEYMIELRESGMRPAFHPYTGELILSSFQVRILSERAKALFLINSTL